MKISRAILIACSSVLFLLAGCISPKAFVDPSFPKLTYDDVKRSSAPLRLKVLVEFQRNGEAFPKADSTLRDNAERILRASGVILPVTDQGDGEIKIVVNNVADLAAARAKGFGTGLTFGLAGTTVTDAYEMSLTITTPGKIITRTAVKHAIHTAIGNTTLPADIETVPPIVAFNRVMEQLLLRVLQDMQKSGEIAALYTPAKMVAPVSRASFFSMDTRGLVESLLELL